MSKLDDLHAKAKALADKHNPPSNPVPQRIPLVPPVGGKREVKIPKKFSVAAYVKEQQGSSK